MLVDEAPDCTIQRVCGVVLRRCCLSFVKRLEKHTLECFEASFEKQDPCKKNASSYVLTLERFRIGKEGPKSITKTLATSPSNA